MDILKKSPKQSQNEGLFKRSGGIKSNNLLVGILYELIRDGDISPGRLEMVVQENIVLSENKTGFEFTNGYLAMYAQDLATRIIANGKFTINKTNNGE